MKLSKDQIEKDELAYFDAAFLCINQYLAELMVLSNRDFLKWLTQLKIAKSHIVELEANEKSKEELLYGLKEVQFQLQYHDILEQKTQHIIEINRAVSEMVCPFNKKGIYVRLSNAYVGLINNMYEQYVESSLEMRRIMGELYQEAGLMEQLGHKLSAIEEICNSYRHKKTMIVSTLENMICNITPLTEKSIDHKKVMEIRDYLSTKAEREIFDSQFGLNKEEESLEMELF